MYTKLEILAAYLPYQLICLVDGEHLAEMHSVYSDGTCTFCDLAEPEKGFETVRPVLKRKEDIDWEVFEAENRFFPISKCTRELINNGIDNDVPILQFPTHVVRWCIRKHYDVFGMIDSGEAVEYAEIKKILPKKPGSTELLKKYLKKVLLDLNRKKCKHSFVYKILFDHSTVRICEKCHLTYK